MQLITLHHSKLPQRAIPWWEVGRYFRQTLHHSAVWSFQDNPGIVAAPPPDIRKVLLHYRTSWLLEADYKEGGGCVHRLPRSIGSVNMR